jgi:predicted anti-sigma-YlaC factor YlaD
MAHPTDDELIEHFCGDADPAGAVRVDAHLLECGECRRAWDGLAAALTIVNDAVPEPPAGFERVMWARVQTAIAADRRQTWTWRQWVPAGALAAAVLMGVALVNRDGVAPSPDALATQATAADPTTAPSAADNVRQNERVLYAALDGHFQQTEALLVELRNAPDRAALGLERHTADDLIAAGRLYRQTAEYTGHPRLVRMLEDLEPVLVEVARGAEQLAERDRAWLRSRIDDDNLIFKVRAVSTDVRARVANGDQD